MSKERECEPLRVAWASSDFFHANVNRHVLQAARRLVQLDERQIAAVETRIELDLRIGYAFTRFISLTLQPLGGPLEKKVMSYGW